MNVIFHAMNWYKNGYYFSNVLWWCRVGFNFKKWLLELNKFTTELRLKNNLIQPVNQEHPFF